MVRLRSLWLVFVCALPNLAAQGPDSACELGRRLFVGELAARGRMVGHSQALPSEATRCANCHTKLAARAPRRSSESDGDFGPALGPDALLTELPRRGGPASRYSAATFCRALREGVDPAHVVLSQAMPRYQLSDPECEALWTFLTTR